MASKRKVKKPSAAELWRRAAAARKGWETRRRNARAAAREAARRAKARKASARKAADTRTRKRAEIAAKGLDRWSRALDKARDIDTPRAWREFRRLDRLRLEQEKKDTAWKRMLRRMLRERAEVFGIDPDSYDVSD